METTDNNSVLNEGKNRPYPVSGVIIIYTLCGGLGFGLILGLIIIVCSLGIGFFIAYFALIYSLILGTPPAFLTGLYLGQKRFMIVNNVGWATVFWVGFFNTLFCLIIAYIVTINHFPPIITIIMIAILGGGISIFIGKLVLPKIKSKT